MPQGRLIELIGYRFGRLVVVGRSGHTPKKQATWKVRCDCGREFVATGYGLRSGRTKSCGCGRSDATGRPRNTLEKVLATATLDPATNCLVWPGAQGRGGYGQAQCTVNGKYGKWRTHVLAWNARHGPVPAGLQVRHYVCGNRLCMNVEHLRIGTAKDNADDRERDGRTARGDKSGARTKPDRHVRGESAHTAKLSADRVVMFRRRSDAGESPTALAREFGISSSQALRIARRESWRHLH